MGKIDVWVPWEKFFNINFGKFDIWVPRETFFSHGTWTSIFPKNWKGWKWWKQFSQDWKCNGKAEKIHCWVATNLWESLAPFFPPWEKWSSAFLEVSVDPTKAIYYIGKLSHHLATIRLSLFTVRFNYSASRGCKTDVFKKVFKNFFFELIEERWHYKKPCRETFF